MRYLVHTQILGKTLNLALLYTVEFLSYLILSMHLVTMFNAKSLPR